MLNSVTIRREIMSIPRMPKEINKSLEKKSNVINTQVNVNEEPELISNYDLDMSMIGDMVFDEGHVHEKHAEKNAKVQEAVRNRKKKQKLWQIALNLPVEYTAADLNQILSRQDRVVVDLKDRNNYAVYEQDEIDVTETEIVEIDHILNLYGSFALANKSIKDEGIYSYSKDEFAEAIKSLKFKKARDVSHLLINEHSKSDSEEMAALKMEVMRLSCHIDAIKNVAASMEAVDDLRTYYAIAIKYCEDYLSFKKKNNRYDKVADVWENLSYEASRLALIKDTDLVPNMTMGKLLGMSDTEHEKVVRTNFKETAPLETECVKESLAAKAVFAENYSFADAFINVGNKKKNIQKLAAKNLEFKKGLDKFKPGKLQILDIDVLGSKVRILQKPDDSLYIIDKVTHAQIPLHHTAVTMSRKITESMLRTPQNYEESSIISLIDSYDKMYDPAKPKLDQGKLTLIMNDLIEYLSNSLGVTKDLFNDIRLSRLILLSKQLVHKQKTLQEIKNEVESSTQAKDNINSALLIEMMELEEARQNDADKSDNVSIYKLQADADSSSWTKEEQSVKNLMAELVFATDTYIMDKYARNPGEYIRKILLDNIEAVNLLVKDNAAPGQDMISKIMGAMALDKVSNKKNDNFSEIISSSLKDIITHLRSLGKVDIKKAINNASDETMTAKLIAAGKKMDESVKSSSELMQENVSAIVDSMFAEVEGDSDEDSLEQIMKNATRTNAGQGLFIKKVLKSYFAKMNPVDQRAMLASALRSCHKMDIKQFSDKELFTDIKQRKLSKYKTILGKDFDKLTPEELKQVQEYRAEKEALQLGSNYFAGLIRGAGPLLHKMLQGIPEENLPKEIRLAIRDVKSKLPPIPDRVVKTMMNAMIKRSNGQLTRIEVIKNLGAASVGQTFRCKIYGRDLPEEGKYVVIKLLRPDCQNRMKREQDVMLDCAKAVNPGMYETYKGQLSNHYMELDLSKESKNIEAGQIYKGKYPDVEPEVECKILSATTDSLMIEEAEGRTLDDILLDSEKQRDEIIKSVMETRVENGMTVYMPTTTVSFEGIKKTKEARNKMIDLANDLIKKRDIMANITKLWIEEAMFGSGYYHADLHAGNILLSDDKGTLIDFGNAVKFTAEQQSCIARMMTAAADGSDRVDLFFTEFNKLLDFSDPDFKTFYDEAKQAEVKEAFENILDMGSTEDAGERIAAALIKASELGVKLPPAIYNFSQGQLRLQKSIDDINNQIRAIKGELAYFDSCMRTELNEVSGLNIVLEKAFSASQGTTFEASLKQQIASFDGGVDKETFISDLLDNKVDKGDLANGKAPVDARNDFDKKYLAGYTNFRYQLIKGTGGLKSKMNDYLPDYSSYRNIWNAHKAKWEAKLAECGTDEKKLEATKKELYNEGFDLMDRIIPPNASMPIHTVLGTNALYMKVGESLSTLNEEGINALFHIYEKVIPVGLELDDKIRELRELQDKKQLTDDKKTALTERIYKLYVEFQQAQAKESPITNMFKKSISRLGSWDSTLKKADIMFKETSKITVEENGKKVEVVIGERFKKKMDEYYAIAKKYEKKLTAKDPFWDMKDISKEDAIKMKPLLKELCDLHLEITKRQVKFFYQGRYDKKVDIKSFGFSDVMKQIILNNKGSFVSKVGLGTLFSIFGSKAIEIFK